MSARFYRNTTILVVVLVVGFGVSLLTFGLTLREVKVYWFHAALFSCPKPVIWLPQETFSEGGQGAYICPFDIPRTREVINEVKAENAREP